MIDFSSASIPPPLSCPPLPQCMLPQESGAALSAELASISRAFQALAASRAQLLRCYDQLCQADSLFAQELGVQDV